MSQVSITPQQAAAVAAFVAEHDAETVTITRFYGGAMGQTEAHARVTLAIGNEIVADDLVVADDGRVLESV